MGENLHICFTFIESFRKGISQLKVKVVVSQKQVLADALETIVQINQWLYPVFTFWNFMDQYSPQQKTNIVIESNA